MSLYSTPDLIQYPIILVIILSNSVAECSVTRNYCIRHLLDNTGYREFPPQGYISTARAATVMSAKLDLIHLQHDACATGDVEIPALVHKKS